jgi:toxin ParE1/3/4
MEYLVKISPRTERDLAHLFQEINADQCEAAFDWYWGLKEAILRLQEHPNRCPVTRKKGDLRHLLFGQRPHVYRVIFRILEKQKYVDVLHVRHGARRKFKESDLV